MRARAFSTLAALCVATFSPLCLAQTPPAPASAAEPPAPAASETTPTKLVRFQADEPGAVLESNTSSDGKTLPWHVVCDSPCERTVPVHGAFRVAGSGYHPSRPFVLPADREQVVVRAEMKSSSLALPIGLSIVGYGMFSIVGPSLVVAGLLKEASNDDGGSLVAGGIVVGLAGAILGTTGVVMLIVRAQDKESKAYVTKRDAPKLELAPGVALDARGLSF